MTLLGEEFARGAMLVALTAAAAWSDVRTDRIPNHLTLPVILGGVAASFVLDGVRGGLVALALVAGVLVAGFLLFLAGVLGGGDGKLLAAVAALAETRRFPDILVWILVTGGVVSVLVLGWKRALVPFLGRLFHAGVRWARFRVGPDRAMIDGQGVRMPYAVVIAIAVCLALGASAAGFSWIRTLGEQWR